MIAQHPRIARCVPHRIMGIAINFDHHTFGRAKEVDYPLPYHVLSTEFEAVEAAVTQRQPRAVFGFGRVVAHRAGAFAQHLRGDVTTPNPLL
jgi:predicted urease superfamily metal-dependent hydrolase